MRIFVVILFALLYGTSAQAETNADTPLTQNLSLGSRSAQVVTLQKILNKDPDTRIPGIGAGSLGKETSYFGLLTKTAVIRFQTKYAAEVLTPVGLTEGNGRVGTYTRAKLNAFLAVPHEPASIISPQATSTAILPPTTYSGIDYVVKEQEKIDIYAGDKLIANIQSKLLSTINAAIASQTTPSTMPTIRTTDLPVVILKTLLPQYGLPGTRVTVAGDMVSTNSAIYFGNNYIVRSLQEDPSGTFSFAIPEIPFGHYDLAVQSNGTVSRTMDFVVTDPKNPVVYIGSISPTAVSYGGTLTISGSGFSPLHNTVITNFQKFTDVPSSEGKTISVRIAPENLREAVRVGNGTRKINMFLYVVNEYGFSDSKKYFSITL